MFKIIAALGLGISALVGGIGFVGSDNAEAWTAPTAACYTFRDDGNPLTPDAVYTFQYGCNLSPSPTATATPAPVKTYSTTTTTRTK